MINLKPEGGLVSLYGNPTAMTNTYRNPNMLSDTIAHVELARGTSGRQKHWWPAALHFYNNGRREGWWTIGEVGAGSPTWPKMRVITDLNYRWRMIEGLTPDIALGEHLMLTLIKELYL